MSLFTRSWQTFLAKSVTTSRQRVNYFDSQKISDQWYSVLSHLCNLLSALIGSILLTFDITLKSNDILRFKDQELLYDNGLTLARIGQADTLQRRFMMISANGTARDSRTMRIATVVAILYLPSNLVMVSFFQPGIPFRIPQSI